MKIYNHTNEELATEINNAIEVYLQALVNKRVITKTVYNSLIPYKIILVNKKFLGRLWNWIKNPKDDISYFRVVKIITGDENND